MQRDRVSGVIVEDRMRELAGGSCTSNDGNPSKDSIVRFYPLSCSPFQVAGTNNLLLPIERFEVAAVRQGKRHDHENDG